MERFDGQGEPDSVFMLSVFSFLSSTSFFPLFFINLDLCVFFLFLSLSLSLSLFAHSPATASTSSATAAPTPSGSPTARNRT